MHEGNESVLVNLVSEVLLAGICQNNQVFTYSPMANFMKTGSLSLIEAALCL